MRVAEYPMEQPARLSFVDDTAVLFFRTGLIAPALITFLDKLLSVVKIR